MCPMILKTENEDSLQMLRICKSLGSLVIHRAPAKTLPPAKMLFIQLKRMNSFFYFSCILWVLIRSAFL